MDPLKCQTFPVPRQSRGISHFWLKLERFLAIFDVAPFDDAASRRHGAVRAFLKARGTPIGPLDTLIAGHALMLNATVVTNNIGEFARVPGLTVEDWLH